MRIYYKLKYRLRDKIYKIKHWYEVCQCKKLYPDYIGDDSYNCGTLKHIWGLKSWDDLSKIDANLYTMNDIDITYDRKSKLYMIGIETAYLFDEKKEECDYLKRLLDAFSKFMDINNYSKDREYIFSFCNPSLSTSAESIEELYTNFRIFVEGYCSVYGK